MGLSDCRLPDEVNDPNKEDTEKLIGEGFMFIREILLFGTMLLPWKLWVHQFSA